MSVCLCLGNKQTKYKNIVQRHSLVSRYRNKNRNKLTNKQAPYSIPHNQTDRREQFSCSILIKGRRKEAGRQTETEFRVAAGSDFLGAVRFGVH